MEESYPLIDFDMEGSIGRKNFNRKNKGKPPSDLINFRQTGHMKDIQHYVMHVYYMYIYKSIINKEMIFIYISIYMKDIQHYVMHAYYICI